MATILIVGLFNGLFINYFTHFVIMILDCYCYPLYRLCYINTVIANTKMFGIQNNLNIYS